MKLDLPKMETQPFNLAVGDTVNKSGNRYMVLKITKDTFDIRMVSYNARLNKPPILTFSKKEYCSGTLRMRRVNLPPVTRYSMA